MKNWLNILLTALTVALLIVFAWATPSPSITPEAEEAHMNMGVEEDDPYAFLFDD